MLQDRKERYESNILCEKITLDTNITENNKTKSKPQLELLRVKIKLTNEMIRGKQELRVQKEFNFCRPL